jgi:glucose/arabinose dehydrogenase
MLTRSLIASVLLSFIHVASAKPEGPYRTSSATGYLTRPNADKFSDDKVAKLKVPAGFAVSVFAKDVKGARMMVQAPNGGPIYVSQPSEGTISILTDADGDGVADAVTPLITGLKKVHGLAIAPDGALFAVALKEVYRIDPKTKAKKVVVTNLPDVGQHENRSIGISPDGKLFIAIASNCNSCVDPNDQMATMQVSELDGSKRRTFAKGLRDTIGFDWHPTSHQLWGMDHGVDWRGDEVPPEELNALTDGSDYGWPYCYLDKKPDPNLIDDPETETKDKYCAKTVAPTLTFAAHSAPISLRFYNKTMFPERYREGAFVSMHGSWNRKTPVGYDVQFVPFKDGKPTKAEPFVSGWLAPNKKSIFGRPAGLLVLADGSLLISDDLNGTIYRVRSMK